MEEKGRRTGRTKRMLLEVGLEALRPEGRKVIYVVAHNASMFRHMQEHLTNVFDAMGLYSEHWSTTDTTKILDTYIIFTTDYANSASIERYRGIPSKVFYDHYYTECVRERADIHRNRFRRVNPWPKPQGPENECFIPKRPKPPEKRIISEDVKLVDFFKEMGIDVNEFLTKLKNML